MDSSDRKDGVECVRCGKVVPRSEMFGMAPELSCAACALGMRERLQVRVHSVKAAGPPVVTFGILGIAAVLFLAESAGGGGGSESSGSSSAIRLLHMDEGIWEGEVWRLLSSAFLHIGVIHILFNCWWIHDLGRAVEQGFGKVTLVLLFVGCAMVSGGLQWAMSGPGVGLSGVVYGLALFLFVHRRTNPAAAAVMNQRTLGILVVWFFLCVVMSDSGQWNIGNWAHGAGAGWGFVVGHASLHRLRKLLVPLAAVGTVLVIFACTQKAVGRQERIRKYYAGACVEDARGSPLRVCARVTSGFEGSRIPEAGVAPRRLPVWASFPSGLAGQAHQRSLSWELTLVQTLTAGFPRRSAAEGGPGCEVVAAGSLPRDCGASRGSARGASSRTP